MLKKEWFCPYCRKKDILPSNNNKHLIICLCSKCECNYLIHDGTVSFSYDGGEK